MKENKCKIEKRNLNLKSKFLWQNFLFNKFFRRLSNTWLQRVKCLNQKHCTKKQNNSATKKQSIISSFCHITEYKKCWIAEAPRVEHSFCKISIWLGIIHTNFLRFSLATFNEFSQSASSFFFLNFYVSLHWLLKLKTCCYLS